MSRSDAPDDGQNGTGGYAVRVKGHLDARWESRFDGLSLTQEADGTTLIQGSIPDQAALHGLLHTVRDLGLALVSVQPLNVQ